MRGSPRSVIAPNFRTSIFVFVAFVCFFVLVFAPVLFSGRLLTSGDGVVQAIPTYFGRTPLIEPRLMLGYPLFADPNQAFWYPVLRAMRSIPGAFDAYAIFPYVIVAFGTYGFAERVSGSRVGALVAALTVSLGGFMISHQGHLMIVHPACWAPCVLWAFAALRERSSRLAIACGSIALALGLTAGTQQPVLYLLLVGCAYAIVFRPAERARRIAFLRDVAFVVVTGLALAATSLVPAVEFALRTDRAHLSLQDFSVFSTGILEFPIRALFPYVFGGSTSAIYARPFPTFGAYTEATNYAGIVTLVLGAVALLDGVSRRRAFFWLAVAVWSAWMAVGQSLGAATLARWIPFYGSFRIPGRHAFEWTFAIAMLASLGVAAMQSGRVAWRGVFIAIATVAAAFAVALAAFAVGGHAAFGSLKITPDATLAVPTCVLLGTCILVVLWKRYPVRWFGAVALVAVACDMLLFAYGSYWHDSSASAAIVEVPQSVAVLRSDLERRGGRYLDFGGETTRSIPANLATLWRLSDATGYVSLEDKSYFELFHASPTGVVSVPFAAQGDATALDLTGVRFLLLPPDPPAIVPLASALATAPVNGFIGDAAIASLERVRYGLSQARRGDALEIVTALGDSVDIPNRTRVADVLVESAHGVLSFPLLAGVDTSESAYDRADVRALVKHARATIYSGSNDAHLYIAKIALPRATSVRSVSVVWADHRAKTAALTVANIALTDTSRGLAYPFYADGQFTQDASHFVERGDVYHDAGERVLENLRVFPHAWIAHELVVAPPEAQLQAIRTGERYGRAVDFHRTVFAAEAADLGPAGATDRMTVVSAEPTSETDRVSCAHACMLVTGDLWYPGWSASIDGARARELAVDYALRGVVVPAGTHRVTTTFAPWSLRIGIAISLCAAVVLLLRLTARLFSPALNDIERDDDDDQEQTDIAHEMAATRLFGRARVRRRR